MSRVAHLLVVLYFAALAFAVASRATPPSKAVVAFWTKVAQCETGGNWRMRGASYSGGTGMANTTWSWWERELGYHYRNAADAPRLVQIEVAEWGYRQHSGFWGCLH